MKKYLTLVVFSHTIFALPFAIIGFVLAWHSGNAQFSWTLFIKMLICMVTARTAAMAFNRIVDAKYDSVNPRTSDREIPAGKVSKTSAIVLVFINVILFVLICATINPLVFALSPIALAVILGYSFTKRFTSGAHLVLGLGLSLAPIGAYLVVNPSFELVPILFSAIVLCWVAGFDIIYSLQDEDFDKQHGLYSIPALLGKRSALRVSEILHLLCASGVVAAGLAGGFGWWYWSGSLLFMGLLFYQHTLVSPVNLKNVNRAFFTTNGVASLVFAMFVIADVIL